MVWKGLRLDFVLAGKTLLAKTLARFVNVPFVIADATTLTQVIPRIFLVFGPESGDPLRALFIYLLIR